MSADVLPRTPIPTANPPGFATRHQFWLRQLIIAFAFSTYFFDRDDIVWRFIKNSPSRRTQEHFLFFVATLLIGVGAALCTWTRANRRSPRTKNSGELLFAIGLASLAPLSGFIALIAGETIFTCIFLRREAASIPSPAAQSSSPDWPAALRHEAAKWGMFLTMIAFSITLNDRLAEILAAISVLTWAICNLPWSRNRHHG